MGSEPDAFGTERKGHWTLSGYKTGATMDFTATVTATDASGNTDNTRYYCSVRDIGGVDDDTGTGTGTHRYRYRYPKVQEWVQILIPVLNLHLQIHLQLTKMLQQLELLLQRYPDGPNTQR